MHTQRLSTLILGCIGILSSFLPWVSMPVVGSANGLEGNGGVTLLLFGIAVALVFTVGRSQEALEGNALRAVMLCAGLAGMIGIVSLVDIYQTRENFTGLPIAGN